MIQRLKKIGLLGCGLLIPVFAVFAFMRLTRASVAVIPEAGPAASPDDLPAADPISETILGRRVPVVNAGA